MTLKILQLNMWQGAFIDEIIDFIKREDFDILTLQEITGGEYSRGGQNLYPGKIPAPVVNSQNRGIDCFMLFQHAFPQYTGFLEREYENSTDPTAYNGSAIFVRSLLHPLPKKVIQFEMGRMVEDPTIPTTPHALAIQISGCWIITSHLAWSATPEDTQERMRQSKKIIEFLKTCAIPFILAGDFNASQNTKSISSLETYAVNLVKKYSVTNTLNPRTHNAKHLFPPGLAVDFIFTSPHLQVKNFRVIDDINLSDHLGLMAEVEI